MSGPAPAIVVCDDEMLVRLWLEEHLREEGYRVRSAGDGTTLLTALEEEPADVVLLDLRLPDGRGTDLLPRIREIDPWLPVIMITAYGEVEAAVEAIRAGAEHFVEKPIGLEELLVLIEGALEKHRLRREVDQYREGFRWQFSDVTLVGRSPAIREVAEQITRIARKDVPINILIRGESGTGKDVVARAIHAESSRAAGPFIRVNCTAIPEHLVETELVGHEGGAFTDAKERKKGLFELAHRGTIFLDEIGDMPLAAQAKLLGVLETHRFRRVGGVRELEVDVHVLAATNRDLEAAVEAGRFREDLYYRLNVVPVHLPPLRERPEDIAPLAVHFVDSLSREIRQPSPRLAPDAITALERYEWPGNARELRNVLERVLLLRDGEHVAAEHLPREVLGDGAGAPPVVLPAGGLDLEELERELVRQALDRTDGNKSAAARLLGLTRDTLRYRLGKYGID